MFEVSLSVHNCDEVVLGQEKQSAITRSIALLLHGDVPFLMVIPSFLDHRYIRLESLQRLGA
ncbi:hypothetical protein RvY_17508 [Ramazzottius varieornatus]|uniref:Uncharacterized protein n=1 Tax=Ramazzottius varieornatus TaxID=947166 RepID=A0A1D1W9D0_RAMVA|nr:hypothetical protein RvY_17508 [Ramazzottius varieornatus]